MTVDLLKKMENWKNQLKSANSKHARIQEKLAEKEKLEFEIWLLETTEEQRRQLAPQAKQDLSEMQKGLLRTYWEAQRSQGNTEIVKGVTSS